MKIRRGFTRDFKLSILNELNVKKAAEVCKEHNVSPNMLSRWKREFNKDPAKAFSGSGNLWKAEAEIERYKRLIGQLYAENDFLKKTTKKLQELKAEEERRRSLR
jgi:transposase-like protein